MVRSLFVGLSGLALMVLPGPALAQGDEATRWAPDAIPSIVNPTPNRDKDAWTPFHQTPFTPSTDQKLDDPLLKGAIDIHAHFGPDTYPRQWDVFEIARRAQAYGMRGIVIKSHWGETATLAKLARDHAAPGLEIFGGLSLNTPVGGINPMAVRFFGEVEGGFGKVVWMPTHDSEHEVTYSKQARPFVRVSKDGALLPQVFEVLDLIKHYDMTLATGHVFPREMLQIMKAAKARGIARIIITHPGLGPMFTDPTLDELKEAVALGGMVEVVASELFRDKKDETIAMMRSIGAEHIILSSDSGVTGTPTHGDALVMAANILRDAGFSEAQLGLMLKDNPATVLGLPLL